jgi:alpha-methylacyl-CoA racemase
MHANGMWEGERGTNILDGGASFYETYETADGGFMAVGCVEPLFYAEFLHTLGLDDPELPFQIDAGAWPEMKKLIGEAFLQKTRAEWTAIFADSDACVSPVLSPWEAHEHPHNRARGAFVEVNGVLQPAPAPRFSRTPTARPVPPDDGGRDVAATLAQWGFAGDDIALLTSAGTVR